MKPKTNKESGWTYIRAKLNTAKELKIEKAKEGIVSYDEILKKMIACWRKYGKENKI